MQIAYYPLEASTAYLVHFVMDWVALLVGSQVYWHLKRRQNVTSCQQIQPTQIHHAKMNDLWIAIGCVFGAGIGNKLLFALNVPQALGEYGWKGFFLGQTVVGGLIGAWLGIELMKKWRNVHHSTGDLFVVPFCLGLMIGRVGCYLAGLHDGTYGVATTLPWGVDFGDGVLRHPTQIYDVIWAMVMLVLYGFSYPKLKAVSGLSFKLLFVSYLSWRWFIDGYKPVFHEYWLGWSAIRWVCVITLLIYMPLLIKDLRQLLQKQRLADYALVLAKN